MPALHAFLARFGYFNHPYISGFIAITLMLFGVFVLFKDRKARINQAFFFITWVLANWFFGNALSMFYAHDINTAIRWACIGYSTAPLMSLAYYLFYVTYTHQFKRKKNHITIITVISIIEILWIWVFDDVKINARALPHVGVFWHGMPRWSWVTTIGMLKYFILSIIVGSLFLKEYKKEILPLKKKQLKSLANIFFVLSMGATEWLVVYGIPVHMAWMVAPFFMFLLAHSIINYRILEIDTVLHQTILWAVTIICLVLPGLIVAVNMKEWLGLHNPYLHYALLALYFIFYINLYIRIRPRIDHLFRRRKYDYQTVLGKMAERIATSINIDELTPKLLIEISEIMYLRDTVFFIISKDETCFFLRGEYVYKSTNGIRKEKILNLFTDGNNASGGSRGETLPVNGLLGQWLVLNRGILEKEQVEANPRYADIRQEALSLFNQYGIEVLVPMTYNDKVNALLGLGKKENLKPYNKKDIELLNKLSQEAGVTVHNALHFEDLAEKERMEQEMKMGRQIQMGLLPRQIPEVKGLKICGQMLPAQEIGGDYFDFLPLAGHKDLGIVIGDVSGKGVAAGLCMAMIKPVIHIFSRKAESPKEMLMNINQVLNQYIGGEKFMTMLYLVWQASRSMLTFSSAGHEHMLVYRKKQKEVEEIETGGTLLGVTPEISDILENKDIHLSSGDKVLLYTDGVTEAHNQVRERFGILRLKDSFRKHSSRPPEGLMAGIREEVNGFIGSCPQYDDITLVVLEAE